MIKKIIISIFIFTLLTGCGKFREYKTNFSVFSSDVNITLYTKNKKQAQNAIRDIKNIYLKYDNYLKEFDKGTISGELQSVLNSIIDLSKKTKNIKLDYKIDTNTIFAKDDNIKYFIQSFAHNEVYEYLKDKSISKFFISLDGYVLAGYPYRKNYFLVGISSPFDASIIKMLEIKNKHVITKNINQISDVNDKNGNISISIVTNDLKFGDFLAFDLLLMSPNDSIDYIEDNNIEAILCYYKNGKEKVYVNVD